MSEGDVTHYDLLDLAEQVIKTMRASPLVQLQADGYFVFHDRKNGGTYDFKPTDAADCLRWICHMNEKSWVTPDHIEQFALLACDRFGGWYQ